MPAAKAARSAANSRTATGRGTKGLVLGGVRLPIERSDVGVRPEVVARQEPPTTASLPAEVGGGLRLGPKGDGEYEDPRGGTEAAQKALARYVEDVGDTRADVVGGRFTGSRIRLDRVHRLRRRLLGGRLRGWRRLLGGRQGRERASDKHQERHHDGEDPDFGLHQGNLLPVALSETIVRPRRAPTEAFPGVQMITNGPSTRKLDKRYNRQHILFQEARHP